MLVCICLDEFIKVTIGEIYCLAPYYKPRFIGEITDQIIQKFTADCKVIGRDFFYYEIDLKDLYKFIENLLMSIDKFKELNLSPSEYDKGTLIDDPTRSQFQFVSMYNHIPEDDKFIDLDACIQNIFAYFEHKAYLDSVGEPDLDKLCKFRKSYQSGGPNDQ